MDHLTDIQGKEIIRALNASGQLSKLIDRVSNAAHVIRHLDFNNSDNSFSNDLRKALIDVTKNSRDLVELLLCTTYQTNPQIIIDLFQDKIKTHVNPLVTPNPLFTALTPNHFARVLEKTDPALLDNLSIETYTKFASISDSVKSAFIKELFEPYFRKALDKTLGFPRTGLDAYLALRSNIASFEIVCREDLPSLLPFLAKPSDFFAFINKLSSEFKSLLLRIKSFNNTVFMRFATC
jgi:hypothetical protein